MNLGSRPEACVFCRAIVIVGPVETCAEYTHWRCTNCLGQFWWPFQNPGAEWYENDIRYHGRNLDPLLTPVKTHLLFLEDKPTPGGSVLDAGCGTGNFLAAAKRAGYQTFGIDFDRDAIQIAREVLHLENLRIASVQDLVLEAARYDCVTFFEVLEHLDQPNEFIKTVSSILRPKGYIALSVPNAASWDVFKVHDKPPRHLSRWTAASMKNFLERNGFQVERMVQIRVPLSFLITKFHFWTKGFLSFGLVGKIQKASMGEQKTGTKVSVNRLPPLAGLKFLARSKDTVLFFIPALFLWIYLFLLGRTSCGLYVLARRKD